MTNGTDTTNIIQLTTKVDSHIEEYREFTADFTKRELKLVKAQETNTESIAALTAATEGLITAWTAANALQRFIKWLSAFGILSLMIAWAADKLSTS